MAFTVARLDKEKPQRPVNKLKKKNYISASDKTVKRIHSLYLSRFTVHSGEQQPGRLPDIITVHGEAPSMLSVGDGDADPLHQRRQYQKGPVGERNR